jgi:hypothetical protein
MQQLAAYLQDNDILQIDRLAKLEKEKIDFTIKIFIFHTNKNFKTSLFP